MICNAKRSNFKPSKIQPPTRLDRCFLSKPACCICALCERQHDKGHFLFCKPLTTKAADVKKLVNDVFRDNDLSWDMVSAICSDGAPAMLGQNSGFGALAKVAAPHIIVTHCALHKHALATKTLPPKLWSIKNCSGMCELCAK